MPKYHINQVGRKFQESEVVEHLGVTPTKQHSYKLKCYICGGTFIKQFQNFKTDRPNTYPCHKIPTTHFLHSRWICMKERCYNPKAAEYKNYGARGIIVEKRWHYFYNYVKDTLPTYKPGLTLDRRNNNGNYGPSNFRWATPLEQSRNTRRHHVFKYKGEKVAVADLAQKLGLHRSTLLDRLERGTKITRPKKVKTSRYKNVCWAHGAWSASFCNYPFANIHIGQFHDEELANGAATFAREFIPRAIQCQKK